jgi:glycosyltransferase involved in cell wall biosynthesis
MPLLTRMPKNKVKAQVVSLAPGFTAGAVLRQSGIPVHDVALSRKRFTWGAFGELQTATESFRPDVIQAWGHTAQLAAMALRSRCDWNPKVVWSVGETAPLPKNAGLIDRQKLKWLAKGSAKVDRIVYTSEASAVLHRRAGFPDGGHVVVPPGVDPTRFKPDFAARKKVREQLGLGGDAFVIGMVAPFQTQHDHPTLIKAVGELIKTNPHIALLLAGHGVQKGNGPLMALVGGGPMGTRTHLLGEWSDMSAFFNACDIACSSSLTDSGRMTLVMAMQCGVPCVATGMGAQGEVIGQFGVAVEPGSPAAFIRGITRIMQLPAEKRVFMAQGARKHALTHFVPVRSMQKYLQLYFDIVGRQALAAEAVPAQEIDASIPAPPPDMQIVGTVKTKSKTVDLVASTDLADPDSIESRVEASKVAYKKYKPEPEPEAVVEAPPVREGDVLEIFESDQVSAKASANAGMNERARGVADELEDLLTPEELQTDPAQQALTPKKPAEKPVAAAAASAAPAKPAEAAKAVEPVKPLELVKPAELAQAVEPVVAIETLSLVEPVQMASPVAAAEPVHPVAAAEPATAVESVVAVEPLALVEPVTVALPMAAAEPVRPVEVAAPAVASMPTIDFVIELEEESLQASLIFDAPPAESEPPSASDSSIQLELLADPPEELKRAVGD